MDKHKKGCIAVVLGMFAGAAIGFGVAVGVPFSIALIQHWVNPDPTASGAGWLAIVLAPFGTIFGACLGILLADRWTR